MASVHDAQRRAALLQAYATAPDAPGSERRTALAAQIADAGGAATDWLNLAFEQFSGFGFPAAHQSLDRAIALDPHLLPARWLKFQYPTHPVPASAADAQRFADDWDRGLAYFEQLDFSQAGTKQQLWGCLGACTAFYRHYLGDATEQQRRYGQLLSRAMAAIAGVPAIETPRRNRPRVLFCSIHFFQHTVGRLFWPVIQQLPRDLFDVHVLHLGPEDDAFTAEVRVGSQFHSGMRPAPDWMRLIRSLQPDAIVYLDLGMDPLTLALAAMRLAPIQASLWGHPVTTGLPTLDYALSPDLMEPADAQRHYTERLVRLPGLGHGLPLAYESNETTLTEAIDGPLRLLCAQSVYKLLPLHDQLFARILAALPEAELHLIPHPSASVRDWLKQRMLQAMSEQQVADAERRIVMHGYRDLQGFKSLVASCQLNLDSVGWSGGMSSIDVLGAGIPTVTLRGEQMRGRQTAALLDCAGASETIVDSEDDYVRTVVDLARDPARRLMIGDTLRNNRSRMHDSSALAPFLADFLTRVIREARAEQAKR